MNEYWKNDNIIGIGAGIGSSPKSFGKNLIIGANDSFLYSINPKNGEIVWKFKTNGIVYSTPVVDDGIAYFGSGDGFLYAIDKKGSMKWRFNSSGRIMSSPVLGKDIIAFGNDEGTFFVLDKHGNILWKHQTGAAIRTTSSLVNDRIIFGSHDSFLYCFDYEGKQQWKFQTGGPMWTCPCIVDDDGALLWSVSNQNIGKSSNYKIYFGSFDGGMYCLNSISEGN